MIDRGIWQSKRFRKLESSDEQLAYLYLMCSKHMNGIAAYYLPDGYAALDLAWDIEKWINVRQRLMEADLIDYDDDTMEIVIKGWIGDNPPASKKHAIGMSRWILEIQSDRLATLLSTEFDEAVDPAFVPD